MQPWERNPDIPEPEASSVDGTFTDVTISANGVWLTISFTSDAEAQSFIDQYANAYQVEGGQNFQQ